VILYVALLENINENREQNWMSRRIALHCYVSNKFQVWRNMCVLFRDWCKVVMIVRRCLSNISTHMTQQYSIRKWTLWLICNIHDRNHACQCNCLHCVKNGMFSQCTLATITVSHILVWSYIVTLSSPHWNIQ